MKRFSQWISKSYKIVSWMIIIAVFGVGILSFRWWFSYDPAKNFVEFIPGMDGAGTIRKAVEEIIKIGEFVKVFDGVPADISGSWSRFRGANADNISTEDILLADRWGEEGPEMLWSVELGEGHAAPVVSRGRVYVLDYIEEKKADALRCFSLDDGREIWRRWYTVNVKRNHGMSRTTPAVSDHWVVTIGPRCHVMCVDAETGEYRWGMDLEREYGTTVPLWYTGQCPLIDGDVAVIAPGGDKALMIGIDCETGSVVWEAPNPRGWKMSHSSIMPMTFRGKKMYVYCAIGGVAGVSASGEDRGSILWETDEWNPAVVAPSPVMLEGGRIFVTAGYGAGSMMLELKETQGAFNVDSLYEMRPQDGLACEQQTPVLYNGYLFGVLPKDAGELRNQFVCYHPDGEIVWSSGKENRFGLGPYLIADDKFFILSDDGVLTMANASIEGFIFLDRAKILHGRDSWGPLALAGGRMLLRDSMQMVCIDVSVKD